MVALLSSSTSSPERIFPFAQFSFFSMIKDLIKTCGQVLKTNYYLLSATEVCH